MCKGCAFLPDCRLIRQVDGCPIGGSISVIFPNKFCVKLEYDVVKPLKPKHYKCYVHDIYSKHIKNKSDKLSEKFNNYHQKVKLAIEISPSKLLKMASLKHLL